MSFCMYSAFLINILSVTLSDSSFQGRQRTGDLVSGHWPCGLAVKILVSIQVTWVRVPVRELRFCFQLLLAAACCKLELTVACVPNQKHPFLGLRQEHSRHKLWDLHEG